MTDLNLDLKLLVTLADAAPCHLVALDLEERIVFANKEMLNQWKLERQDTEGKRIKEIVGEDAAQVLHSFTQDVLAGENVEYVSPFFIQGELRYFKNTYCAYRDAQQKIIGFIATGVDITDKVSLEERLKGI